MLDAKKIGYLRRLHGPDESARQGIGSDKRMWNRLRATGHVDSPAFDHFRRSPLGEAALLEYDAALTHPALDLLERVRRGDRSAASDRGMQALVSAGLVHFDHELKMSVIEPMKPDEETPGMAP